MLFSMFVSLPTGQVSGLFSFRCLFRTGPDRVFRTVLAVKRLFSFSSANLFSLTQLQKLVNHFFIFLFFTGFLPALCTCVRQLLYITNRFPICQPLFSDFFRFFSAIHFMSLFLFKHHRRTPDNAEQPNRRRQNQKPYNAVMFCRYCPLRRLRYL